MVKQKFAILPIVDAVIVKKITKRLFAASQDKSYVASVPDKQPALLRKSFRTVCNLDL